MTDPLPIMFDDVDTCVCLLGYMFEFIVYIFQKGIISYVHLYEVLINMSMFDL